MDGSDEYQAGCGLPTCLCLSVSVPDHAYSMSEISGWGGAGLEVGWYVTPVLRRANSAFHPSGIGK